MVPTSSTMALDDVDMIADGSRVGLVCDMGLGDSYTGHTCDMWPHGSRPCLGSWSGSHMGCVDSIK